MQRKLKTYNYTFDLKLLITIVSSSSFLSLQTHSTVRAFIQQLQFATVGRNRSGGTEAPLRLPKYGDGSSEVVETADVEREESHEDLRRMMIVRVNKMLNDDCES
uniref:Uncharacterized protein n=1 Tax=Helianthus annuus TaxID=4232 RepID=A0A251V0P8_HELAN